MIQAENPDTFQKDKPKTISKVPGFSSPVGGTNPQVPEQKSAEISEKSEFAVKVDTIKEKVDTVKEKVDTIKEKFFRWWHKIAFILLVVLGIKDFWEAIHFIVVDYKELNLRLELHTIETPEVNQLISQAIITAVIASVSILFAIRLTKVKETTAHSIDLLIATFLIITGWMIRNFLTQLDLLNFVLNLLNR